MQKLEVLDQEEQEQEHYEWAEALGWYQQKDENNVQQCCGFESAEHQSEAEQAAASSPGVAQRNCVRDSFTRTEGVLSVD